MDRDQLLGLFPAERSRLLASLARLVGPTDAQDLATETLLRALAAIDEFRGDAALSAWLHRIGAKMDRFAAEQVSARDEPQPPAGCECR